MNELLRDIWFYKSLFLCPSNIMHTLSQTHFISWEGMFYKFLCLSAFLIVSHCYLREKYDSLEERNPFWRNHSCFPQPRSISCNIPEQKKEMKKDKGKRKAQIEIQEKDARHPNFIQKYDFHAFNPDILLCLFDTKSSYTRISFQSTLSRRLPAIPFQYITTVCTLSARLP